MLRVLLGLLLGLALPSFAWVIGSSLRWSNVMSLSIEVSSDKWLFLYVGIVSIYGAALLFGAPLFVLLFRRRNWLGWWQLTLLGMISIVPLAVYYYSVFGPFCCPSRAESVAHVARILLVGAANGLCFWVLAAWRNPVFGLGAKAENAPPSLRHLLLVFVVGLGLPLSAFAFVYRAAAIDGWVADAETGKPLEGVIVVAHWQLKGGLEGGTPVDELQIYETMTDEKGRYHFPGWGPKFALSGRLYSESPELLFFKPGYRWLGVSNDWYRGRDTSTSDWNGKTVKLEPFKGTPLEYDKHLSSLNGSLWTIGFSVGRHSGDYCGWKAFPQMLRSIDKQYGEFERLGIRHSNVVSDLRSNDSRLQAAGCGSVDEFLSR